MAASIISRLFTIQDSKLLGEDVMIDHCFSGNESQLATLLEDPSYRKAINDVGVGLHDNVTPLEAAFSKGRTRIMEMLIEAGANVNQKGRAGMTLLHRACQKNDVEMIKFLVSQGADIKATNNEGLTPDQLSSPELNVKQFWCETWNANTQKSTLFQTMFARLLITPLAPQIAPPQAVVPAPTMQQAVEADPDCFMQ